MKGPLNAEQRRRHGLLTVAEAAARAYRTVEEVQAKLDARAEAARTRQKVAPSHIPGPSPLSTPDQTLLPEQEYLHWATHWEGWIDVDGEPLVSYDDIWRMIPGKSRRKMSDYLSLRRAHEAAGGAWETDIPEPVKLLVRKRPAGQPRFRLREIEPWVRSLPKR